MSFELPVLENLRVASPCGARWDEMQGDAHARFCGQCQKNVYDQHGNYVVIDHGNGEYSLFAHLIPGSIKVRNESS